jgi:hypothetical protein
MFEVNHHCDFTFKMRDYKRLDFLEDLPQTTPPD